MRVKVLMCLYPSGEPKDLAIAHALVGGQLPAMLNKLDGAVSIIKFRQEIKRELRRKGMDKPDQPDTTGGIL